MTVSLKGNEIHEPKTGSKIYVHVGEKTFYKELTTTKGFQSSSTHKLHFGLGDMEQVDSLSIRWPDGKLQVEKSIKANTLTEIVRKTDLEEYSLPKEETEQQYTIFPYVHIENNFLDYEREP